MANTKITRVPPAASLSLGEFLQDLNGEPRPRGLLQYFREVQPGHSLIPSTGPWEGGYRDYLRLYTDVWLATGRRKGAETPSSRHPVVALNQVVERVVEQNRLLPAAGRDGYAIAIVASSRGHLLNRHAPGKDGLLPSGRRIGPEAALSLAAAEKAFVAMLMSDYRLKLARCAQKSCGRYFPLGKWNHTYIAGTLCAGCQQDRQYASVRKRVQEQREAAKQALYAFVAKRFARQIVPGKPWYRNAELKQEIAAAINAHLQQETWLQTYYRRGVTGKWVEGGQRGQKNWSTVEKRFELG